jgi:hypothetical protein
LTVNTNHVAALSVDRRLSLWTQWIALRNGDPENVDGILASTLVAHLPGTTSRPPRSVGHTDLLGWAASVRSGFLNFQLSIQVGPILGVYLIAGRWGMHGIARASGPWGQPGTVVEASGVDILRIEAGRIAELWINADCLATAGPAERRRAH